MNSLAVSSQRTYASGFNSYLSFCSRLNCVTFPLEESTLELYVCSLARKLAFSTIKTYLCSIQYYSILNGFSTRISSMDCLYYVLRGIRGYIGSTRQRTRRQPITIQQLHHFHQWITTRYSDFDSSMLKAATSVAFFGLLRSSEYCSQYRHRSSAATLARNDIKFSNNLILLHLRESKTDPFKEGVVLRIGSTNSSVCPVQALSRYIMTRGNTEGPLFMFQDGSLLTRSVMSTMLSSCFPGLSLNTHSFRIGGASSAASNGFTDAAIQILGRWSSDAYKRYLHYSDDTVQEITRRMAQIPTDFRVWDSTSLFSSSL